MAGGAIVGIQASANLESVFILNQINNRGLLVTFEQGADPGLHGLDFLLVSTFGSPAQDAFESAQPRDKATGKNPPKAMVM